MILLALVLWPTSPDTAQKRYFTDADACRRRVGIPDTSDPRFADRYQHHYGAWARCMIDLGHGEELRRGIIQ